MPEWFDCARFLAGVKGTASLRLNAAVERAFVKHGTVITTRLLVLDKVEGANVPIAIRTNGFRELVDLVATLPVSASMEAAPHKSSLQARTPFLLVTAPRRPLPTPTTPAPSAIGSPTT